MQTVEVEGVRLAYAASGPRDGPVVVLLHAAFRDHSDWDAVAAPLAERGYRVFALDDRGHGASTPFGAPENPWTGLQVPTFVSDAAAFVDAVAPGRPVHLVGHSRGATVAGFLAYEAGAKRHPSVTLAASPPDASAAFRLRFAAKRRADPAADAPYATRLAHHTIAYLAAIPDDHFPGELWSQYKGDGLVLEAGRDALYAPAQTMLWHAWFNAATRDRFEGDHDFLFDGGAGSAWFLDRLLPFLAEVAPVA